MRSIPVLAFLALLSCADTQTLPEPGAEGPVEVVMWEGEDPRPSHLRAARIAVPSMDLELYELFDVELRRPQERGHLVLHADRGELRIGRHQHLSIDPPVRVSGLLEGLPILALSQDLVIDADTDTAVLRDFHAYWSLQKATATELRIRDAERFQGDAWHTEPGEAGMAAVLGALPHHPAVIGP